MSRLPRVLFGGNYIYRYIVYHMHEGFLPLGYAMNGQESVQKNMQKEKGPTNQCSFLSQIKKRALRRR